MERGSCLVVRTCFRFGSYPSGLVLSNDSLIWFWGKFASIFNKRSLTVHPGYDVFEK